MNNDLNRIKELIDILNEASKVYYQGKDEIMSNAEYDELYDELTALEEKTGIILNNSPTVKVGYEVLSSLPKENHIAPMLSLSKTKEVDELVSFIGDRQGLLSLKLDGLSIILTYENGVLAKALTRGNGEIGEVITANAKTFKNIPMKIPFMGTLVVRGEALIKYSDFEELNKSFSDINEQYKNPRNLCSGTVRQLNSEVCANRNINYFVYDFIYCSDDIFNVSKKEDRWNKLGQMGFAMVPYKKVDKDNMATAVSEFSDMITAGYDLPSDGLVLTFDDVEYSQSLGRTAKYPKDSIAFKWQDETAQTTLRDIEWSASRTGLINPIAVFDPVELEGTVVSRASVHNISIMRQLQLGIEDEILVYKANMIIPQILENITKSNGVVLPKRCPVCGEPTRLKAENDVEVLVCDNPDCYAKKAKQLSHFVSRNAMNIVGMSEATIEKFINEGFLKDEADFFALDRYKDDIVLMEGFGEKSYENMMKSIENAKNVDLDNFIFSLGITGIGLSVAGLITDKYPVMPSKMKNIKVEELVEIEGVGDVLAQNFADYFKDEKNDLLVNKLEANLKINIPHPDEGVEKIFENLTFVITGSLNNYANRNELKEFISQRGGKVASSVSKNTDYLINNDILSNSSKNKKAKELGVEIITENDFKKRFLNN